MKNPERFNAFVNHIAAAGMPLTPALLRLDPMFDPLNGRTIWIVDAHRGDGKPFVVHADELLTAFLELESAIRGR
jgi:hypothetical protein